MDWVNCKIQLANAWVCRFFFSQTNYQLAAIYLIEYWQQKNEHNEHVLYERALLEIMTNQH